MVTPQGRPARHRQPLPPAAEVPDLCSLRPAVTPARRNGREPWNRQKPWILPSRMRTELNHLPAAHAPVTATGQPLRRLTAHGLEVGDLSRAFACPRRVVIEGVDVEGFSPFQHGEEPGWSALSTSALRIEARSAGLASLHAPERMDGVWEVHATVLMHSTAMLSPVPLTLLPWEVARA